MKLGIVVGHERNRPGAYSEPMRVHEYEWNEDLAARILAGTSSLDRKVFLRNGAGVTGAYAESDAFGSDLTVELHFNSSHSQSATGTGILYYPGSGRGRAFAALLARELRDVLGLPDWPRGSGGIATPHQASGAERRGEHSLRAGRAPATILEPFFGSNPGDCQTATGRKDAIAAAVIRAAERMA